MQTQCEKCGGKGKIVKESCPICGGTKVAHGTHEESVVVLEAGMPDGHEIVLRGEGDEHPDYAPADIIFKVVTTPHRHFRRTGNDLHLRMRISLLQALVGFSRTIKHLDEHPVVLEKTSVTKPGEVMRVEGEGMPVHNFPSEKGDLFVTFEVVFPTEVSAEQAQEFRRLLGKGEQRDEL
jgi:DnaJ-class molecular chaperone